MADANPNESAIERVMKKQGCSISRLDFADGFSRRMKLEGEKPDALAG